MHYVVVSSVEIEGPSTPTFNTVAFRGIVIHPDTWDNRRWSLEIDFHNLLLADESRALDCIKGEIYSSGICYDAFEMTWSYEAVSVFKDIFTGRRNGNGTKFRKYKTRGFFGD